MMVPQHIAYFAVHADLLATLWQVDSPQAVMHIRTLGSMQLMTQNGHYVC